ncbi:hypothetical protein OPT61_g166 [Boeremia exigua]|uniref:Uncharacterized protein n=1 Tax=Boeremia exigua TaxID=749465 RepID=A0ACC2IUR0_9PLEO|nr:hypothetical protein OPT61_g166 [Boeremia exigua]
MFCERCQSFWVGALAKAQIPEKTSRAEDIIWAQYETILHTSIRDLKSASDSRCRICRIIYFSPADFEHASLLKNHDEQIHVVLTLNPAEGPLPLLHVEFREATTAGVRIPKRLVASCSGILGTQSGTQAEIHHSGDDLATMLNEATRLDNDHTGSDGALQLASYWIKSCVGTHEKCRPAASSCSSPFLPTRLLDVSNTDVRLVESKTDIDRSTEGSYLALSHCWGRVPIIRTLKENYEQHKKGISPEKLSKTFREAVHTTRKLGFRYIWIDSLCIVQDDGDDWAAEAATMCDVYQYAMLTIAAAHAPGGDIGCFTERDGLLNLPFYVNIPLPSSAETPLRLQFTAYGRPQTKDLGGGDPALYGRAWVLQEQLLSPRMLIFDGAQIKWECLTLYGSEGSPTSGTTRHDQSHKHIRSGIMDPQEFFDNADKEEVQVPINNFWSRMKHQFWCSIVMDFTHRGMTNSNDRLAAIAGIGQALARHTKHEYLAGLWSENFFVGLLWSLPHNEKYLMSAMTNFDIEGNPHIRHKQSLAPSWSWASVTAPVMYGENDMLNVDCVCELQNVKASGSIDKQVGNATIHGHIRKGYVNAIYPFSMREAVERLPQMTAPPPGGRLGLEHVTFKDRSFHPIQYFLFSEQNPNPDGTVELDELRRTGPFRFVRGTFRPDEIIDPTQEITFIAIAQRHLGKPLGRARTSIERYEPLRVHTIALVPTGDSSGIYRRVGLAIWEECAWYGYLCGWKDDRTRRITSPREWDQGFHVGEYLWEEAYRKLWWDDLELYKCHGRVGGDGENGRWKHEHEYKRDRLPDLKMYKPGTRVEPRTVVIV